MLLIFIPFFEEFLPLVAVPLFVSICYVALLSRLVPYFFLVLILMGFDMSPAKVGFDRIT